MKVIFYREDDGTVPLLEWLDSLVVKAQDKCRLRIERLAEMGHGLRRPEADYLRDDVYELRVSLQGDTIPNAVLLLRQPCCSCVPRDY